MLVAGGLALRRARREMPEAGRISRATFALAFVAYVGVTASAFGAAFSREWPFTPESPAVRLTGGMLIVSGGLLYGVARLQFRSFRRTWGLQTDRLVTGGVYAWSRNPQCVGWFLVLVGTGLCGRSISGLLLAGVFGASCLASVPLEERFLYRRFGPVFEEYRERVPRFLGMPRRANGQHP